jgi:hypothetical protein
MAGWENVAKNFDRRNMRMHVALVKIVHDTLNEAQGDLEYILHFASFSCGMAVEVRNQTGIDICTLTFPKANPPLPASHPLLVALEPIDEMIEESLRKLDVKITPYDRDIVLAYYPRFYMALVWKSWLFERNTPLENWGSDVYYALKILRMLSTVSGKDIVEYIRTHPFDAAVREHVREDDWPPREFIKLYFDNRDRIMGRVPFL